MRLVVALESAARYDVKNPVGALAVLRGEAAALDFEVVDVPRIELRADIAGDIRIRNRHAVDEPIDLMSTANVKLIMNDHRTRNEVCDHRKTVGAVCSGSALDVNAPA